MKLHLGAGNQILEGYINIDNRQLPGINIVRDILRGLPFEDNTIEKVVSENFLEHIPQTEVIWVMNEIWRVLKPGGIAHHVIPLAGTFNDWQDPTHLSRWGVETFDYFTKDHYKNNYYDQAVSPWIIQSLEVLPPKRHTLEVIMIKPNE